MFVLLVYMCMYACYTSVFVYVCLCYLCVCVCMHVILLYMYVCVRPSSLPNEIFGAEN